jgi:hypothetical protein
MPMPEPGVLGVNMCGPELWGFSSSGGQSSLASSLIDSFTGVFSLPDRGWKSDIRPTPCSVASTSMLLCEVPSGVADLLAGSSSWFLRGLSVVSVTARRSVHSGIFLERLASAGRLQMIAKYQ